MKIIPGGDVYRYKRGPSTTSYILEDRDQSVGVCPTSGPRIALIKDYPSAYEARVGEPFKAQNSDVLYWAMSSAGLHVPSTYRTCLIDRVVEFKDQRYVHEAVKAQTELILEELHYMHDQGVRVILCMGELSKSFFGINGSLHKTRGSVYEWGFNYQGLVTDPEAEPWDFVIIPTYDPDTFREVRWNGRGKDRADRSMIWISDMAKAKQIAEQGYTRIAEVFKLSPTFDEVMCYLDERTKARDLIAVDLETCGLDPKRENIVCIGFATSSTEAFCLPFYRTGRDVPRRTTYFSPDEREIIDAKLNDLFSTCPQMYQNSLFDVGYMQQSGYTVDTACVKHDTMLLHHAINPELEHKLGFITSIYGQTPYWKEDFIHRDGSIWEMDFTELQKYNLRDCVVLFQVLDPMMDELTETGTEPAYAESLRIIGPVLEMMQTGIKLNRTRLKDFKQNTSQRLVELEHELRSLGNLPEVFNLNSSDDMRLFMFGVASKKYQTCSDYEKHKPSTKVYQTKKALYDMVKQVKPLAAHSYKGRTSPKTKQIKTDADGRVGLQIHLQNRLSAIKDMKRMTEAHELEAKGLNDMLRWLAAYEQYAELNKLMSTYTEFNTDDSGRVHTKYLIHGTVTGRLSCVAGDTVLPTSKGPVCIAELEISEGLYIPTHMGEWGRIVRKIYKGIDEMLQLRVSSGEVIKCTGSHLLLTPKGWVSASRLSIGSEVYHVSLTERPKESGCDQSGIGIVLGRQTPNDGGYSQGSWGNPSHGDSNPEGSATPREAEGRKSAEVLPVEDGGIEPCIRKVHGEPSELEGGLPRPKGVLDPSIRWEEVLCTPASDGRSLGSEGTTKEPSCPSYQWERGGQQAGQPRVGNTGRSPEIAYEKVRITERTHVGPMGVFDIEVEGDHSYVAHGLLHHNSREPNLQNIPKSMNEVRKCFVTMPGWKIVSIDYNSLEFGTMAYETHEPLMIEAFESGISQHDLNTKALFDLDESSPDWKSARAAAKIFQFATQYGGSLANVYEKIIRDVPELRLTRAKFEAQVERMFSKLNQYHAWRQVTIETAERTRKVTSAFGRCRMLYGPEKDIGREALNFPCQSAAAHVINDATYRIWVKLRTGHYKARLQAQTHDQLYLEVPDEELHEVIKLCVTEMEAPVSFYDTIAVFPVGVEVGGSWGELEDYDLGGL